MLEVTVRTSLTIPFRLGSSGRRGGGDPSRGVGGERGEQQRGGVGGGLRVGVRLRHVGRRF